MSENTIYTIGFTKKSAEQFFGLLKNEGINLLVDVRLNNLSQLAGFSKFPDVAFFLKEICNCGYVSDKLFSPEESTLKDYKANKINWDEYVRQFEATMSERKIEEYIKSRYQVKVKENKICLLCSEETPEYCHRRLIAEKFSKIFGLEIVHLK